jgi:D-glycero-D-manno-heptose 1,7-bisphosphate phosphatase
LKLLRKHDIFSCLFLDADGVLWPDQGPGTILRNTRVSREAQDFIRSFLELSDSGTKVVVVTNQTSAARGDAVLQELQTAIRRTIRHSSAKIDSVYACFHHPNANVPDFRRNCTCRKPGTGLFLEATNDLNIDLSESTMVGDRITDIQASIAAGVKNNFLLVDTHMFQLNETTESSIQEPKSIIFFPIERLSEALTKLFPRQ